MVVLQRTAKFGLKYKRRLACPLKRLPLRPNGPRQRRRMDLLRRSRICEAAVALDLDLGLGLDLPCGEAA